MLSKNRFTFVLNRFSSLQKLLNIAVYPLFYLVRMLRRIRSKEGTSIVIISLHRLGDTVFTIPAVKEIIKHYNKDVYLICYEDSATIYKEVLPDIKYVTLNKDEFYLNGRIAKGKTRKLFNNLKPKTRLYFELISDISQAHFKR